MSEKRRISIMMFLISSVLAVGWIPVFYVIEQTPLAATVWTVVWMALLVLSALGCVNWLGCRSKMKENR